MTKICFILGSHWDYQMGGSEYQVKLLIDYLKRSRKFQIFYVYSGKKERVFEKNGVITWVLHRRKWLSKLGKSFFLDSGKLSKILKRINPDVIYQRVGSAYTGITAFYSQKYNCPSIWHISLKEELTPWKFRFKPGFLFGLMDKKILEYGVKHMSHIIGQAGYQDRLLRKNYQRKCDLIVPNFHPIPEGKIRKKGFPVKVVWMANFKEFKRPELFVRLAGEFEDRKDVEFVMIGRPYGRKRLQTEMERKINAQKNLKYRGEVKFEEANRILEESHILVNTSLYEGFPNTFIQAWMRKVPVVSLSVDPDKVVEKNKIGFHSKTFSNLEKDLDKLIINKELREKMGERARKYAFENHSIEKNAEKMVTLLKNTWKEDGIFFTDRRKGR